LAESWFNRTQQKIVIARETNEQSEKFASSSNLIKQITKEISKHEDLLDESEKQYLRLYLEEATAFCDEITRLDREEKIIAQFQELPIAQRMSLYERLGNYLNNTEDES
jgi:predicted Rossmann fold nucleotide-binding protein DprA/Smf involved in DNA uptake